MDRPNMHSDFEKITTSEALGGILRGILSEPDTASRTSFWTSRRGTLLAIALILGATLAAFSDSFSGQFVFDDHEAIAENQTIRHLWPIWSIFAPPSDGSAVQRRPIVNASLAINYAISGENVWSYHALNLAAHMMAALLLFGVVRRTLLLPGRREQWSLAATPLALAVAMLWAVHPLLTDAVTYIIQRTEVIAGMFYLLTLYCVIRGSDAMRPARWYAVAVAACALAMGSKEVAISAPVVVLLYDRVFLSASWRELLVRRKWLYVGLAMTWGIIALVLPHGKEETAVFGSVGHRVVQYAMAQCGVVTHYLWLSFWPTPLIMDYGVYTTQTAGDIVPYLCLMTLLIAAVVLAFRYQPWLGFVGVWFFAILAPSSSIVPLQQQIAAEKRMYLPLAAVVTVVVIGCFLVGRWLVQRGVCSLRMAQFTGCLLLVCATIALGATTFDRNADYATGISIWQDTVAKVPCNVRAYNNYGKVLADSGRLDEAIAQYEKALALKAEFGEAHNNYGAALFVRGQIDEAIGHYEKAIAGSKEAAVVATAHYNLGNALRQQKKVDEAMTHYELAVKFRPRYAEAHNNYGMALASCGQLDKAIQHYRMAIQSKPDYALACNNLGNALARSGQIEEAIGQYENALSIDPDYADAHNNLGSALARQGQIEPAMAEYRKALELNPKLEMAHTNLGSLLAGRGQLNEAVGEFRQALQINPQNVQAKQNLDRAIAHQENIRKGQAGQNVSSGVAPVIPKAMDR